MSFVPPIVFDRNAHEVPAPVRLVDMFWAMYVSKIPKFFLG